MIKNIKDFREEVIEYIVGTLKKEFNKSVNPDSSGDDNFFSQKINLSEREMLYLFFLLEKQYNLCFFEEEINLPSFYTLKGLSDIIVNRQS